MTGALADGAIARVRVSAPGSAAANFAFDVTPARLITGLITERGVCAASEAGYRACSRSGASQDALIRR